MSDQESEKKTTPVYVPYATFISALENLRTHGIPGTGKIDRTLWDSQSGAVQAQLILAFRFLGLIDEKNHVLAGLKPLVEASGEERKQLLRSIIGDKYRRILSLELHTISQGQLEEAFRGYGVSGSTLVRAIRFFVKACSEIDIPISRRIAEKSRSNGTPRRLRKTASSGNTTKKVEDDDTSDNLSPRHSTVTWESRLLEKFPVFDPAWTDDLKTKWFEGFSRLMNAKS